MDSLSQQRIASVLSASYSDAETRQALAVLDARLPRNTAEARRQLRVNVQAEAIRSNAVVIRQFSQISQQLSRIGAALGSMTDVVAAAKAHVDAAVADTGPVMEEAAALMTQIAEVRDKQALMHAFTAHFVVAEDEVDILTSSAEPVNARFFEVLRKVKRIHTDCEVLLAGENQRVGLEIMDQMGKHLQAAFQKLYHWIQRELKSLSLENPQINAGIRRALRVLAERPTLFQNCLDFFAEARQKIILDSFYAALTGVNPSTNTAPPEPTKPIELYAHDPLRYVGDMLAWVHSAAVGEQEALEVLFVAQEDAGGARSSLVGGIEEGLRNEPWAAGDELAFGDQDEAWDASRGLMLLVDKDIEAVCHPLKVKVEQVITSHEDSTLNYRLSNLIEFYRLTFEKLVGSESALLVTMNSLQESALRQFYRTLDDHVRTVRTELSSAPADLSPPTFLREALQALHQLLVSYDTSLAPPDAREAGFAPVLTHALDPYLAGCDALTSSTPTPTAAAVFELNCVLLAQATLQPFAFAAPRADTLAACAQTLQDSLVANLHDAFLRASGLRSLLRRADEDGDADADVDADKDVRAEVAARGPDEFAQLSQRLNEFLPEASMDARAQLAGLQAPRLVEEVVAKAADRFVADFEIVEGALLARFGEELEGGEEQMREFWPRRTEEVRVLLS